MAGVWQGRELNKGVETWQGVARCIGRVYSIDKCVVMFIYKYLEGLAGFGRVWQGVNVRQGVTG